MNKKTIIKQFTTILVIIGMLAGCTAKSNQPNADSNNTGMSQTQKGALMGGLLGSLIGVATGDHDGKRAVIGGILGAAVGSGIGYSMDKQAKEVAEELDTKVNNNPQAPINPDNDLIVSNTENYVKIMLRDNMVFETNSAIPTQHAARKIEKISNVLKNYPNTIVQVVGFTDNRGSYEYNQKLSEQRASNVGNTIHNNGTANKIFSKGCSYNKPITPNTNTENMALNRRVEIYLYSSQNAIIDTCVQ